jgi:hypothetical protein
MDVCDGANWTEMDIEDLKSATDSGCSIEEAPYFFAAPIASTRSRRNAQSWD